MTAFASTILNRLRVTRYDAVRTAVGFLLMTAAGLKGYHLAREPVTRTGLLDSRWAVIVVVEFALLLGLLFLANPLSKPARAGALACPSMLTCLSLLRSSFRARHRRLHRPRTGKPPVHDDIRRDGRSGFGPLTAWAFVCFDRSYLVENGCRASQATMKCETRRAFWFAIPEVRAPLRQVLLVLTLFVFADSCGMVRAKEANIGAPGNRSINTSRQLAQRPHETQLMDRNFNRASGPYCGIYSLWVCLSALGIETRPGDFVSTRYVGSFQGSTSQELIDAAKDFGAKTQCFSHLTQEELARVQTPMILHMRSSCVDPSFRHWVAFLGCDGARMRIVDAPHPLETISPAELLANWDGSAIAISRDNVDDAFLFDGRIDYLFRVGLLVLALYLLRRQFGNVSPLPIDLPLNVRAKALVSHVGVILGFSFLLGLGYHTFSTVGFLENPTALAEVTRRHYSIAIPEISLADAEKEIHDSQPLVLDARHVIDFRRGALPGARSMPVESTLSERQQVLADVPRDKRIIVYCQSATCGYADEVARFLAFNGYTNVAVYRDGYRLWSRASAIGHTP